MPSCSCLARRALAVTALAAGLTAQPVRAQGTPASATMVISAVVLPTCTVSAGTMAFGALDGVTAAALAQAPITLECTPGTPFAVTLDQGQHGARRMAALHGSGYLDYEIFQDAAGTRAWGGTAAQGVTGTTPEAGKVALNAYGRVSVLSAAPGTYTDLVTISVEF